MKSRMLLGRLPGPLGFFFERYFGAGRDFRRKGWQADRAMKHDEFTRALTAWQSAMEDAELLDDDKHREVAFLGQAQAYAARGNANEARAALDQCAFLASKNRH